MRPVARRPRNGAQVHVARYRSLGRGSVASGAGLQIHLPRHCCDQGVNSVRGARPPRPGPLRRSHPSSRRARADVDEVVHAEHRGDTVHLEDGSGERMVSCLGGGLEVDRAGQRGVELEPHALGLGVGAGDAGGHGVLPDRRLSTATGAVAELGVRHPGREPNLGVDRNRARGGDDDRVEIELGDLGDVVDETADAEHQIFERGDIGRRCTRYPNSNGMPCVARTSWYARRCR